MRRSGSNSVFLTIVAVAALFLSMGVPQLQHTLEVRRSWKPIPAEVTESKKIQLSGGRVRYQGWVRYGYQVDEKPYSGSLSFENLDLLDQYPVGSSLTILVNPEDASQSLESSDFEPQTLLFLGLGTLLLAGSLVYVSIRKRLAERAKAERKRIEGIRIERERLIRQDPEG